MCCNDGSGRRACRSIATAERAIDTLESLEKEEDDGEDEDEEDVESVLVEIETPRKAR